MKKRMVVLLTCLLTSAILACGLPQFETARFVPGDPTATPPGIEEAIGDLELCIRLHSPGDGLEAQVEDAQARLNQLRD